MTYTATYSPEDNKLRLYSSNLFLSRGVSKHQTFDCSRLVSAEVIEVKIGEPLQSIKSEVDEPFEHSPLSSPVDSPAAFIGKIPAFVRRSDTEEVLQSPIGHERITFKVKEDIAGRWRRQPREAKYNEALLALDEANVTEDERQALTALIENDLADAQLAAQLGEALTAASLRLVHIRQKHSGDGFAASPIPDLPMARLRANSADLQTRSSALLLGGASEARKKLIAERDELADQEWFAGIKEDALAELARRKTIAELQKAVRDTATNRATGKSAELAEKLVTNTLRAQFAKEVDKLGVAGLAIELRQEKTAQGVPFFRVSLIKKPDAPVGEVLSEGEHRCVALAAFLAEMATTESRSALVFDDPVSSLDHMHREAVAKRLAEESLRRQIVVFTHDLAFLFLLNESCREKEAHIAFRSINKGTEFAGFCQANAPPNAQPVDKVIEGMSTYLRDRKIHFDKGNRSEWYLTVRSLQEQLRTTWERAVEEALSPVVKRLANKVDTKGLFKITVLTTTDCNLMREAFGRCSALLHSEAEVLNKPLPDPRVIEAEIAALSSWVNDIRDRQATIQVTEVVTIKS